MYNSVFFIILAIVVVEYIFKLWLDMLNKSQWSDTLPDELKEFYDHEKYQESQRYEREKFNFSLISGGFSFVLIILVLFLGGFGWLDSQVSSFTDNTVLQALIFFGSLGLLSTVISLPFDAYFTFVIEEKFGFNRTSTKTFVFDKIKSWLLIGIIGGGILAIFVLIYNYFGYNFWMPAWAVITFFSIFMTLFYSTLIVPMFNKQIALPEGDLRDAIKSFADKVHFGLDNIFTIDGSKRSSKANAYFTGMGRKKRIVLYDTLLDQYKDDEIVAILAHEVGHYKKKHIQMSLVLSILTTGLMLFFLSLFIRQDSQLSLQLCQALGANVISFHVGILAFGLLYGPLSFITGLCMNLISRKNEYSADSFACKHFKPESLKDALIKLSVKNLSNLTPHPTYVFFHYSHPPLLQRIRSIENHSNVY